MPVDPNSELPIALLLCDDLMFTSRITGTARSLGLHIGHVRSQDALKERVQQQTPAGVVVDLAQPGLELGTLVAWLRENCQPMPCLVAYGSHVDAPGLQAARAAGCNVVLPRSKLVEHLPQLLSGWMSLRHA